MYVWMGEANGSPRRAFGLRVGRLAVAASDRGIAGRLGGPESDAGASRLLGAPAGKRLRWVLSACIVRWGVVQFRVTMRRCWHRPLGHRRRLCIGERLVRLDVDAGHASSTPPHLLDFPRP